MSKVIFQNSMSPFVFVTGDIETIIAQAKSAAGDKHVGIGSANIAQ
jgi:hypothetical protein